ncbi:hypothetical protein CPB85DRAFT_1460260 [Mucidula mucida]|nr:hypothetical protein CPB85DRAFT_1460260 [Mucidula mucida]
MMSTTVLEPARTTSQNTPKSRDDARHDDNRRVAAQRPAGRTGFEDLLTRITTGGPVPLPINRPNRMLPISVSTPARAQRSVPRTSIPRPSPVDESIIPPRPVGTLRAPVWPRPDDGNQNDSSSTRSRDSRSRRRRKGKSKAKDQDNPSQSSASEGDARSDISSEPSIDNSLGGLSDLQITDHTEIERKLRALSGQDKDLVQVLCNDLQAVLENVNPNQPAAMNMEILRVARSTLAVSIMEIRRRLGLTINSDDYSMPLSSAPQANAQTIYDDPRPASAQAKYEAPAVVNDFSLQDELIDFGGEWEWSFEKQVSRPPSGSEVSDSLSGLISGRHTTKKHTPAVPKADVPPKAKDDGLPVAVEEAAPPVPVSSDVVVRGGERTDSQIRFDDMQMRVMKQLLREEQMFEFGESSIPCQDIVIDWPNKLIREFLPNGDTKKTAYGVHPMCNFRIVELPEEAVPSSTSVAPDTQVPVSDPIASTSKTAAPSETRLAGESLLGSSSPSASSFAEPLSAPLYRSGSILAVKNQTPSQDQKQDDLEEGGFDGADIDWFDESYDEY